MSKSKFKHWVYSSECGLWFSHEPRHLSLTDEAYQTLEDNDWCGYMRFKEGVDYVEVEEERKWFGGKVSERVLRSNTEWLNALCLKYGLPSEFFLYLSGQQSGAGHFCESFCRGDWCEAWNRADSCNRASWMDYMNFYNALIMEQPYG